MPTKLDSDKTTVLTWATDVDEGTKRQAVNMANMPFVAPHAALMADAHLGYGVPIGAVIPTHGAIMPAAVGVDIGCGMIAAATSLTAEDLPNDLHAMLSRIEAAIPAGVGQGHDHEADGYATVMTMKRYPATDVLNDDKLLNKAVKQMGTLGSGNHFVEVSLDETGRVWVVLHSGSRGIGNMLARKHVEKAKGLMAQYFIELPDPDLAYFVEGTEDFDLYMADLLWAQEYALRNRSTMMEAALHALEMEVFPVRFKVADTINCHHNYTAKEHHYGENIWVTRKGAIRARTGEYGVIPGSMGTSSYIVRGLGNKSSFTSASHGAGRAMSRTKARKTLSLDSFSEAMQGRTWLDGKANKLLDEHPAAYKNIDTVMLNQADLVAVEHKLTAVLNYKGA